MAKTINLPSGSVAEIMEFKGKHVRQAQRLSSGNADQFLFALISLTTKVDGKEILMEDLDEMAGMDVMALMGEFGEENFTSRQKD